MRTLKFELPSIADEEWTKFEQLYKVPQAEVDLIGCSAEAGRRGNLTRDEFILLARWKSPRPTKRHQQNSDALVHEITTAAFGFQNDVEKVVELTRLSGVNVRTASAILHLCFPTQYPLLDVRAMAALGIGDDDLKTWDELQWLRIWRPYIDICRHLSAKLGWHDLRRTDRALWSKGRAEAKHRMLEMRKTPHEFLATVGGKCSACGLHEATTAHATFARFTDQPHMEVVRESDSATDEE